MTVGKGWWLAERTGRVLLLGAVAFWWGLIVVPRLVSLAFPELLSGSAIPLQLNPDVEGSVANTVSAVSLFTVALLALGNVAISGREALRPFDKLMAQDAAQGWIAAGGWTVLAVTLASVAREEMFDFQGGFAPAAWRWLFALPWSQTSGRNGALLLLIPLIVAFVLTSVVFLRKGLRNREVRAPFVLGLIAWLLAPIYDEGGYRIAVQGWYPLSVLLEETLEFSGALLIGLGTGVALRRSSGQAHGGQAQGEERGAAAGVFSRRRLIRLAVGSVAVAAVLGGIVVFEAASAFREPLVDTRGSAVFNVSLYDDPVEEHSLVQELGVVTAPVGRLRLRVTNSDPQGRSGVMLWRVMEAGQGGSGRMLREGRVEVAAGEQPRWRNIDFPPLMEAEGRALAVQLVAEVEPEAHLRIGGTKTDRLEHLQFWVNGNETWPDQRLELVAYGPSDLTLSKFQGIWRTFRWSWVVLAGAALAGLWIITFIPALLVTAALRRGGSR